MFEVVKFQKNSDTSIWQDFVAEHINAMCDVQKR